MAQTALTFSKKDGGYVAEFSVEGDWNLHLELPEGKNGYRVMQKSVETGKYAPAYNTSAEIKYPESNIVDVDFSHIVYPKYIYVWTSVQPTSGKNFKTEN